MDGYFAALRVSKEKPKLMPDVLKCVKAHYLEKAKEHSLGFEWNEVGVWPITLALLATKYDLLNITYKSNSATCYMIKDIEGIERALKDIEAGRIATYSSNGGMSLRLWLSATTMKKLRAYVEKELSGNWDAEALVIERALNLFLKEGEPTATTS